MVVRSWCAGVLLTVLCSASMPAFAKDAPDAKTRKGARTEKPNITSVVSATHPLVKHESRAAGSTLRIEGVGFGESTDASATLRAAGIEEGIKLKVLSWKDKEILLQLPSVTELGIDSTTAAALSSELTLEKPVLSMSVTVELSHGETRMLDPLAVRIALASIDFDQDGVLAKADANDLDPSVH